MLKIQPAVSQKLSFRANKNNNRNNNNNDNNQTSYNEPKRALINGALALATLTPMISSCTDSSNETNNNSRSEKPKTVVVKVIKQNKKSNTTENKKEVKITEGLVTNRSMDEIEKITGLSEIEYKTAVKILLDGTQKCATSAGQGKMYNLGTKYEISKHIFSDNDTIFKVLIGDALKNHGVTYEYNKAEKEFIGFDNSNVKITREKNGDFTCTGRYFTDEGGWGYKEHLFVKNFTKDGALKPWDYIPNTESDAELKELQQKESAKNSPSVILDNKKMKSNLADIKEIPFFNNNKDAIAKFATALGLSDIEHINKKGTNIFFVNAPDGTHHLNLKKSPEDNDTFVGIVDKVLNNGKSEIYLLKAEIFSTNKSDKLVLSKMRVVQDGLDESSPIYKKYIKETSTTGGRKSTTSHELSGKSRNPWFQLFVTQKFYDGKLSSQTVDEIDELVTESNSDGKVVKIISVDKKSGKITVQGK